MTYNDIKLASLQKMFHDVTDTKRNMVTAPYLDKMNYVCNCAIHRITATGFGKKKYLEIVSVVPVNLLGDGKELYNSTQVTDEERYTAKMGKSYFFELCGKGKVKIYVGSNLVKTIENTTENFFQKYKGIIENSENRPVTLAFQGGNIYLKKNVAIFNEEYSSQEDVYEISQNKTFDMNELCADFFKFDSENSVVCQSDNNSYSFVSESIFLVDGTKSGVWKVPYIAYPNLITDKTPDDEEINLPENLCSIIPYYIASELYLEEDSGLCVGWRNKFEAELRDFAVNRANSPKNRIKFVSLAGELNGKL